MTTGRGSAADRPTLYVDEDVVLIDGRPRDLTTGETIALPDGEAETLIDSRWVLTDGVTVRVAEGPVVVAERTMPSTIRGAARYGDWVRISLEDDSSWALDVASLTLFKYSAEVLRGDAPCVRSSAVQGPWLRFAERGASSGLVTLKVLPLDLSGPPRKLLDGFDNTCSPPVVAADGSRFAWMETDDDNQTLVVAAP